jgi:hypothetical protein
VQLRQTTLYKFGEKSQRQDLWLFLFNKFTEKKEKILQKV